MVYIKTHIQQLNAIHNMLNHGDGLTCRRIRVTDYYEVGKEYEGVSYSLGM
jgi:hypothetical protein